jgi:FkbM family methyltransferase
MEIRMFNYNWSFKYIRSNISNIVEVGSANLEDALVLSEHFDANVLSFEPDPRAFRICEEKLMENFTPKIRIMKMALSDKNGEIPFHIYELGSSSLHKQKNLAPIETQIVRVRRFDSLNIDTPDLVVMDAQGHEGEILVGFGEKLHAVHYLVFEVALKSTYENRLNFVAINRFLAKNGFRYLASSTSGKGIIRFWVTSIRSMIWSLRNSGFRDPYFFQSFTDVLYVKKQRDCLGMKLDKIRGRRSRKT